ncbi:hypothetical protein BO94DRAFT_577455 [Aspergillus sclerotioniger CBS 115572]|uniref:S-adenosyl-L-methionine-dependent methyltransferase n=1 Tax=Aspergillus sclerotioniger CBS 115572 TaxID=1450535 RepID=A0A317W1T9_9EURO|nr:hypothetical protein BO94DRAFT_577455 [Aspergillus sclerotioniger CBS 115572]PWY78140.1 hypothetical protein BO94DRAFT_577455 [Aspergillus sclerotioniger CBS 115572]
MSLPLLTAQYYQQLEPPLLTVPDDRTLLHPTTQDAIYRALFAEPSSRPLPPPAYRTRVLKRLITRLESLLSNPEEDEISDNLLETYSTLLCTPKPSSIQQAQQLTYITYTAPITTTTTTNQAEGCEEPEARTILTSESRNAILTAGTTGHRTWEAALHLATYLSATSEGKAHIAGKRVLELGAGTGLVSMLCAKYLGAEMVVATDREVGLMRQIGDCAERNQLERVRFRGRIWEWGRDMESCPQEEEDDDDGKQEEWMTGKVEFDVALGADLSSLDWTKLDRTRLGFITSLGLSFPTLWLRRVVLPLCYSHLTLPIPSFCPPTSISTLIYDVDLVPLFVQTAKDLFENYCVREFLISATLRNEHTFGAFLKACEDQHLTVERIPFESPAESEQTGFFHSTAIPIQTYRISYLASF